MEQKEKLNVLFTEKYEHNVLSHFIAGQRILHQSRQLY
jgi:hypothetical protein